MTDLFIYKYLTSVPRELASFLITDQAQANQNYLEGQDQVRPSVGFFGRLLYDVSASYDYVEYTDMVGVSEELFWQNRLMHTQTPPQQHLLYFFSA